MLALSLAGAAQTQAQAQADELTADEQTTFVKVMETFAACFQ